MLLEYTLIIYFGKTFIEIEKVIKIVNHFFINKKKN